VLRIVLAVGLALHGLIHVLGFVVAWRLGEVKDIAYSTSAVWGKIELGEAGARALGVAWLLGTAAFLAAALGVGLGAPWGLAATTLAAAISAVLCLAGSPAAIAGLVIDVAILLVTVVLAVLR
jgi:hypothetical protein